MKRTFFVMLGSAALVAAILLLPRVAPAGRTPARLAPVKQEQAPAAVGLEGPYRGYVTLGAVVGGTFADALATPTPPPAGTPQPSLGQQELGLVLSQPVGNSVTGYIDLDATYIFTRTGVTRQATPYGYPTDATTPAPVTTVHEGPKVTGSFDGTNLVLTSDPADLLTSTGLRWVRQFRLVGARVETNPDVFEGEYRETFKELDQPPITMIGTFRLSGMAPLVPVPQVTPTATTQANVTPTATATRLPAGSPQMYLPLITRP